MANEYFEVYEKGNIRGEKSKLKVMYFIQLYDITDSEEIKILDLEDEEYMYVSDWIKTSEKINKKWTFNSLIKIDSLIFPKTGKRQTETNTQNTICVFCL